MQKRIIKLIALLNLVIVNFGLTACTSNSNPTSQPKSAQSTAKLATSTAPKSTTPLTVTTLLQQSERAMKKLDKFQVVSQVAFQNGQNQQLEKITGTYFKSPLNVQLITEKTETNQPPSQATFYLDQYHLYAKNGGNWVATPLDSHNLSQTENLKKLANLTGLIFKESLKNCKLTREEDHYLLQNQVIEPKLKAQLNELLAVNNYQGANQFAARLSPLQLKDFSYEAHFDQQTLLPQKITYAVSLVDGKQQSLQLNGALEYNLSLKQKRFSMPQ